MALNVVGYIGCCGAYIYYSFSTDRDKNGRLNGLGKGVLGRLDTCILNDTQNPLYEKDLLADGWRMVDSNVVNANTGHRLYLWARGGPMLEEKKKETPVLTDNNKHLCTCGRTVERKPVTRKPLAERRRRVFGSRLYKRVIREL